ncbi:hypothetical protein L1887_61871 [Cichorium endivia]|nr:hypothetical protein L1887_61871 [Cichorium endivia]
MRDGRSVDRSRMHSAAIGCVCQNDVRGPCETLLLHCRSPSACSRIASLQADGTLSKPRNRPLDKVPSRAHTPQHPHASATTKTARRNVCELICTSGSCGAISRFRSVCLAQSIPSSARWALKQAACLLAPVSLLLIVSIFGGTPPLLGPKFAKKKKAEKRRLARSIRALKAAHPICRLCCCHCRAQNENQNMLQTSRDGSHSANGRRGSGGTHEQPLVGALHPLLHLVGVVELGIEAELQLDLAVDHQHADPWRGVDLDVLGGLSRCRSSHNPLARAEGEAGSKREWTCSAPTKKSQVLEVDDLAELFGVGSVRRSVGTFDPRPSCGETRCLFSSLRMRAATETSSGTAVKAGLERLLRVDGNPEKDSVRTQGSAVASGTLNRLGGKPPSSVAHPCPSARLCSTPCARGTSRPSQAPSLADARYVTARLDVLSKLDQLPRHRPPRYRGGCRWSRACVWSSSSRAARPATRSSWPGSDAGCHEPFLPPSPHPQHSACAAGDMPPLHFVEGVGVHPAPGLRECRPSRRSRAKHRSWPAEAHCTAPRCFRRPQARARRSRQSGRCGPSRQPGGKDEVEHGLLARRG